MFLLVFLFVGERNGIEYCVTTFSGGIFLYCRKINKNYEKFFFDLLSIISIFVGRTIQNFAQKCTLKILHKNVILIIKNCFAKNFVKIEKKHFYFF